MKAVIIEDEQLAIENLKFYLKDYPIDIIGSANCIDDAAELIKKTKPEVVFLDINLLGENGFDLLEKVDINFKLVFVTAYDEYAVQAFEVNALDYLVKPLSKARVAKTVERLLENENETKLKKAYSIDDSIFLNVNNRASFVKIKDIIFIEADSAYSKIYLASGKEKVFSRTLKQWEEILPRNHFIRVHRSYMININFIKEINKKGASSYEVLLNKIDKSVEISRRYLSIIRNQINF